jgi:hypothetical protein
MKRFVILGIVLISSLVMLNTCYYDSMEYLYPSLNTQCDTSNVTYSVSVKGVLGNNSCYSCHSNSNAASQGGNIQFENYADLKTLANSGQLMGAILHSGGYSPMPKSGGSISDCDKVIIKKWIDNQTPNN